MRRTIIALAACLVVVGLVAAPGAVGKKKTKAPRLIGGTVTLVAPSPAAGVHTTTATGNVAAQASCRKNRYVRLTLFNADGVTPAGAEVDVTTGPNGDYTAPITLPAPTPPATATYTLKASVDQLYRKSGKGKKSKKFICGVLTAAPVSITVS